MAASKDTIRQAAVLLISKGLATPFEIAKASGQSRQICRYWSAAQRDSRQAYVNRLWAKTLARAGRFPESHPREEKKPLSRKVVEEI